jgi:putative endonuclease
MIFVYVIRSKADGRFYVGMTENVVKRLSEHNKGKTKSTKGFKPWELVLVETYSTRNEARRRETYLKGGSGKEFIKRYWSDSSTGYLPAGRQGAAGSK